VSYEDGKEIHYFYDRFGNPTTVQGDIFRKVYEKDVYGRNTKLIFLNREGESVPNQFGYVSYEWFHQLDGSIIEERKNKKGEIGPLRGLFGLLRTRMIFGENGYFTTLQNVDDKGNIINTENGQAILRYFYDAQGRFSRWEVYDEKGEKAIGPSHTAGEQNSFYHYDLNDINFFDINGNPALHWSGVEKWHFVIDQYGNRTALEFYTHEGSLMNGNNGYATVSYDWSEDGRFLNAYKFFDRDGKKTSHKLTGVHHVLYKRDQDNLIIEVKFLDTQGNLAEKLNSGIAQEKWLYNEEKALIEKQYLDAKGQKVEIDF